MGDLVQREHPQIWRLILRLRTIFCALIYGLWAHRAVIFAIASFSCSKYCCCFPIRSLTSFSQLLPLCDMLDALQEMMQQLLWVELMPFGYVINRVFKMSAPFWRMLMLTLYRWAIVKVTVCQVLTVVNRIRRLLLANFVYERAK